MIAEIRMIKHKNGFELTIVWGIVCFNSKNGNEHNESSLQWDWVKWVNTWVKVSLWEMETSFLSFTKN